MQISTGVRYSTQSIPVNSIIDISSRGASWVTESLANSWSLVSHIDLTPVSGKINTSPVTASLPVVQIFATYSSTIEILAADWDNDQVVRCRWSYQGDIDECGDACFNLPNAQLNTIDCTITWTGVLRAQDVANGLSESTYIVAITAEDFVNASSTTPLSSVSHQMLVHVSYKPAMACSAAPTISGFPLRDQACYGVSVGSTYSATFQGTIRWYCANDSIVDFISTAPYNMHKGAITRISNYTWIMTVSWTPTVDQKGLQPLCVAAVDNNGLTSSPYCIMFAVGGSNPYIKSVITYPNSISPSGTVMSTQTRFSFEVVTPFPLRRTTRSSTYIRIYKSTGVLAYQIDCRYSPDVYFLNDTVVFYVYNPSWTLGATYFITITDGVATTNQYCGIEAGASWLGNSNSWRFTVWNPSVSSTTTQSTTTSTATTHTVTTRVMGTTTYNSAFTTTGIPGVTYTTSTSTTSTTSTSATTSTTTSATTTTTTTTTTSEYVTDVNVISPKDWELACLQPVTIATVIVTALMIPIRLVALINLFIQLNKSNEKDILKARKLRRRRLDEINAAEREPFL